ncbi:MAG: GldG family protein [Treponema sp.]|nr:GldG family protein [Treponema sp.]
MTKKQLSLVTLLSIFNILFLLLLSRRFWFRLDLTAHKAHTLAPVSRNLHSEIEENVRISYYLSSKLLSLDPAPSEIIDMLREYEARSRRKIQVTVRDPAKYPLEVERFGLYPQPLSSLDMDELNFSVVYSGIVIEYLNNAEVLPFVYYLDTLEYDITSRIRSLASGKRRELGVIAPEGRRNWNDHYGILNQAFFQSGYSVLPLRAGEEIPDTLPVLFVLGGSEELDEYSLYHIDRYIQLGGRVFFGVESVNVDLNTLEGRLKNDKGLLSMISYYGITLGQSLVLDQACLSVQYSQLSRPVRYPPWVRVLENQSSEDHPLVAFFGGVDLFWASPLYFTLPESGAVKGETLFTSSPNAWLMADTFFLSPEQSSLFALGSEETAGEKILAAALEGTFPSWFEGVEKPRRYKYGWDDDEEEEELPPMPPAPRESRIVVVGDADIGSRLLSQQSGNLNFLLKAADWLGKDDDIVGIRNRQSGSGRLDRITDEAKQRGVINFSRILNIVIVPMMIAIYGITRLVKRNRKKEQDHGL